MAKRRRRKSGSCKCTTITQKRCRTAKGRLGRSCKRKGR
jgi:hypothetical protein